MDAGTAKTVIIEDSLSFRKERGGRGAHDQDGDANCHSFGVGEACINIPFAWELWGNGG
jgi:hypothetical protein